MKESLIMKESEDNIIYPLSDKEYTSAAYHEIGHLLARYVCTGKLDGYKSAVINRVSSLDGTTGMAIIDEKYKNPISSRWCLRTAKNFGILVTEACDYIGGMLLEMMLTKSPQDGINMSDDITAQDYKKIQDIMDTSIFDSEYLKFLDITDIAALQGEASDFYKLMDLLTIHGFEDHINDFVRICEQFLKSKFIRYINQSLQLAKELVEKGEITRLDFYRIFDKKLYKKEMKKQEQRKEEMPEIRKKIAAMAGKWSHKVYDRLSNRYTDGGDFQVTDEDVENISGYDVQLFPPSHHAVEEAVKVMVDNSGLKGIEETMREDTTVIAVYQDGEETTFMLIYED